MLVNTANPSDRGEILIYEAPDGSTALDVRLQDETLWLNLNQISELFERDKSVISKHLRNVFATAELDRAATVAFFATVQEEGGRSVTREVEYFNLDAILSVGYRVNSSQGRYDPTDYDCGCYDCACVNRLDDPAAEEWLGADEPAEFPHGEFDNDMHADLCDNDCDLYRELDASIGRPTATGSWGE